MARDDFTLKTKHTLALRVGYRCSHPDCGCFTVGPNSSVDKATLVGEAAHITAASPDGARYDTSLTNEERRHISNGIWLCATHATLVDRDEREYSVELLLNWKNKAEAQAKQYLGTNPLKASIPEYEEFVTPHLKLEPDSRFRFFGGTVSFDPFNVFQDTLTIVKMSYEGDVSELSLVMLGTFAVRAYLGTHLSQTTYMQSLFTMRENRLQKISGVCHPVHEDNFDRFAEYFSAIDFTGFSIPDDQLFDAVAGIVDGEWHNFLFDLTDFWFPKPGSLDPADS